MNLANIKRRLDALEKRRTRKTCECPPDERYDFNLLTAEERLRMVTIAEKAESGDPDPCPVCGRDRAPVNYDRFTDTDLMDIIELLERTTVENGPHEWGDLFEMTEATT